MIDEKDLQRKEAELEELLAEKFGLKRGPLSRRLRKLGRRAPKYVHQAGAQLVEARQNMGHPKLALLTDADAVDQGYRQVRDFLRGIDATERRKDAALAILGSLAFNLLAVAALLLLVLLWRGHL